MLVNSLIVTAAVQRDSGKMAAARTPLDETLDHVYRDRIGSRSHG
jgi:hypothetical protein